MQDKNKKVLVTGAAGFIGFHLVKKFAAENFDIIGLDNLNEYYDPRLKYDRLRELGIFSLNTKDKNSFFVKSEILPNFKFIKMDLIEMERITDLFKTENFDIVIHLAAQAGVRLSLIHI